MERQPRFPASIWVPHGELIAKIGVLVLNRDFSGIAKLAADNAVELGNFTGAVIKSLRDAGYTVGDDGKVIGAGPEIKELKAWGEVAGDANGSNRLQYLQAGVVYAVKFTVPTRPVVDATPQVTCTISLRPFGAGDVYGKIVTDPKNFVVPTEQGGAGGTTFDSIDFETNQGKTFYFVFVLGKTQASTDANVLVQLPKKP